MLSVRWVQSGKDFQQFVIGQTPRCYETRRRWWLQIRGILGVMVVLAHFGSDALAPLAVPVQAARLT